MENAPVKTPGVAICIGTLTDRKIQFMRAVAARKSSKTTSQIFQFGDKQIVTSFFVHSGWNFPTSVRRRKGTSFRAPDRMEKKQTANNRLSKSC